MPAIEARDPGKRFGGHWILTRVDLTLRRGEAIALFGGNGSGKTTLLKMLATLLAPSRGSLSVLGHDVARETERIRRRIRLLAHEKQLYGTLTVCENLRLCATMRGGRFTGHGDCMEGVW